LTSHYTPLEQEALLHIAGPDTLTFLQGQLTCDTRNIDAEHALPGAFCTPQGRVVCDFLLCQLANEHFALRLRRDIRPGSAATFGKYIVFSKAELDAERDDWQIIACWGEDVAAALESVFGTVPREHFGAKAGEGFVVVQTDREGWQFECYVKTPDRAQLLNELGDALQPSSEAAWQALQISSGIGRVQAPTSGEFIPQMLNYDLTGHVSFNKGCYTGQEVVARMHYRGKPKRRMYLAELPDAGNAPAGTALYSSAGQQSVGNIVNSASVDSGPAIALVVATADGVQNGLHLEAPDGPPLRVRELPYSLEPDPE